MARKARSPPPPCCPEPRPGELFLASETDRLRACLVHAPGRELDRLIPANYRWQLYDDLLHLERAQAEHRTLRELLGRVGARVHEFTDLLARVYEQMSGSDRRRFLQRVHDVSPGAPLYVLRELERERDPAVVARALIEGVEATNSFAAEVEDALYHIQPMANLIFMSDAAVVLLDRVVQGYMSQLVRMPEEIVVETVIRLSNVFGPRGTGEFWIDPAFRERHRMRRTAREYVQLDAARMSLRLGAVDDGHGMPARFFVFRRDEVRRPKKKRGPGDELSGAPKVSLTRAAGLEEALALAGLVVKVRWIPEVAPWEAGSAADGPAWIALQQSLWAHALNLLAVAPGVLVGLDRHAAFYRSALGAECIDAEREVLAGPMAGLRCCALIAALRARGGGRPVVLTLRGDELSRARGGARSLVMPLVREREEG